MQPSQPFLGGETEPAQLLHISRTCPCCEQTLAPRPSNSATAIILDVVGPIAKQHVPMRCNNPTCQRKGLYQWHNYFVDGGKHIFNGAATAMQCIMLTCRFGVSVGYLEQLHLRMVREHVSFAGEADVAKRLAKKRNCPNSLPERLRLYLAHAWYAWRFMLRREALHKDATPDFDLLRPVEEYVSQVWDLLVEDFEAATALRAREARMKTDVHVMDGNAKNRRLVCAALLRQMVTCARLGRSVCVGCPRTPLLGSVFCSDHASHEEAENTDFEILHHEVPEAGGMPVGVSLRLLVRETGGEHRELWVSEDFVDPRVARAYFKNAGEQHRAAKADKRRKRLLERQERMRVVENDFQALSDIWTEFTPEELQEILSERSTADDLGAVGCNTHKETEAMRQQCVRTAGLLCSCLSSGVITSMREVFGCESLSQRYLFVSSLVGRYPEIEAIVHDDACHMHKFCSARGSLSAAAARLAPPQIHYICDIFHMTGHIDAWCMVHCNPKAPHLSPYVENVRTSVCEFTFTWFSQCKHQSKHMSEWGFKFFLQEMCAAHNDNEAIFEGDTSHLTHRSA